MTIIHQNILQVTENQCAIFFFFFFFFWWGGAFWIKAFVTNLDLTRFFWRHFFATYKIIIIIIIIIIIENWELQIRQREKVKIKEKDNVS